jgi:O-antigen ligase
MASDLNIPTVPAPRGLSPKITPALHMPKGLSLSGYYLFVMGLLLMASAFDWLRADIGGLKLHPALVLVALALPFIVLSRLQLFPWKTLLGMAIFVGMYVFSSLGPGMEKGEVIKLIASVATIVVCALMIRRPGDLTAAVLGMSIGVALLAIRGILTVGDNPLGVTAFEGNKNVYSFFALPTILLACFIIVSQGRASLFTKYILFCCTTVSTLAIFMSGNRSGWLGCIVIAALLLKGRRAKSALFVAVFVAVVAGLIFGMGRTDVVTSKLQQMEKGKDRDFVRVDIFLTCIELGLTNPVAGVSPQELPILVGRRLQLQYKLDYIQAHNVIGQIIGGSGLICFAAFLYIGWSLIAIQPLLPEGSYDRARFVEARSLVRMMLCIWLVRGLFSEEIIFSPGFSMGIGMAVGICILHGSSRVESSPVQSAYETA